MIPEIAKPELIRKRQAGQTWTSMARWLAEEYGRELHRSTIQRWYDREILDTSFDVDVLLDEAAANMADEISPEEEEDLIKDRIRLDKRVVTFKSEVLVDTIKRYVTPLKAAKQYPTRKPGSGKRGRSAQVMVAPLTDTHVGDNVSKEQTIGLNE